MEHRHLNHQQLTPAAIDDIIQHGKRKDWEDLRLALLSDPGLGDVMLRICSAYTHDPYAQRHHFWAHYVAFARRRQAEASLDGLRPRGG